MKYVVLDMAAFMYETSDLDEREVGVFWRLFSHYLKVEHPLTHNDVALVESRLSDESFDCLDSILKRCFIRTAEGHYVNRMCDAIIRAVELRRNNAHKSGNQPQDSQSAL